MVKRQTLNEKDLALRKWCIEVAVRWPWSAPHYYQNQGLASVGGGYKEQPVAEPNILARANQILNWVKTGN